MSAGPALSPATAAALREGQVIPAHPLALTPEHKLDERRQRALTRYYASAGAGGIAVGVHTTQFAIREPRFGLLRPVLELASETARECEAKHGRPIIRVAGICGETEQAVEEAELAASFGYDIGLLNFGALADATDDRLIEHAQAVGQVIALFGFYLQPSVGGRVLSFSFWRRFAEIPAVVAIKIAPFDRYRSIDVVRAVAEAGRAGDIALYTGNDDSIVSDLLTRYSFGATDQRIVGGLLGHWAVWTRPAVDLLREIHALGSDVPRELLTRAVAITDCNAAFFDVAHRFCGCIAGIHEILRRQGLLQGIWCLDPDEGLSPGQHEEIDRVYRAYPELNDDAFVAEHRDTWLR